MMKSLLLAAIMTGIVAGTALAEDRYQPRPPVILSPDLSAPWVAQLGGPNVRPVVYTRPVAQRRSLFQWPTLRRAQKPAETQLAGLPGAPKPISAFNEPQFLTQIVTYDTKEKPGTIVIDTNNRFLYLVMSGGKARRYGVGVGKPGFEWAGVHKVTRKSEWPEWTPPSEMISREAAKGHYLPARMDGGPANPLGARAMYLGSSLYRIHGTNAPWTIGSAVSSGCIRLRNEDVVDLYDRVKVGTRVIVI